MGSRRYPGHHVAFPVEATLTTLVLQVLGIMGTDAGGDAFPLPTGLVNSRVAPEQVQPEGQKVVELLIRKSELIFGTGLKAPARPP